MAGVEKLIEKMKRQPNNIKFSEAEKVLKAYGYELAKVRGSHHISRIREQVTDGLYHIKNL